VLLYYITNRRQFAGTPVQQRDRLLAKIADSTRAGVDLIQLRERDLSARELYQLASEALCIIRETRNVKCETRLLINSRLDVALASGADGVHLRGDDFSASDARAIWAKSATEVPRAPSPAQNVKRETRNVSHNWQLTTSNFLFGASCHSPADILSAEAHGADFVVYAPVFEKHGTGAQAVGLEGLQQACSRIATHDKKVEAGFASGMPILALGGVTLANARDCMAAGAAGIAAIRLFQDHDVAEIVEALRKQ
jgi:thiamine-phosphate pyrophosphorylase